MSHLGHEAEVDNRGVNTCSRAGKEGRGAIIPVLELNGAFLNNLVQPAEGINAYLQTSHTRMRFTSIGHQIS